MTDPLRPSHVVTPRQQLQRWRERTLEQIRDRLRRPGWAGGADPDLDTTVPSAPVTHPSIVPGLFVGAVVALLAVGAVWAWQTWSNRVSVPIDDRLPMLLAATGEADGDLSSPATTPIPAPGASVAASPALADTGTRADTADSADGAGLGNVASSDTARIVVHVAGAVMAPGVVTLEPGERVVDALEAAGGPSVTADLDRVNLAALVIDGERIHVPAQGEDQPPAVVAPSRPTNLVNPNAAASAEAAVLVLDVNTATAAALEELPGVGPAIAQAIVQTRLDRGPFLTVEELLDVPGIGESKLAQIEPHVLVG